MRCLLLASLLVLLTTPASLAQCVAADSTQSTFAFTPQPRPCHYVFYPDGSADEVEVTVTARDDTGTPIQGLEVALQFGNGTDNFHPCGGPSAPVTTDAQGMATVRLGTACGCGDFDVAVITVCPSDLSTLRNFFFGPFTATSPDLDGSCPSGPPAVTVIDLALLANCLTSYSHCCDYDCDGDVDIIDVGLWAGGLGRNCP